MNKDQYIANAIYAAERQYRIDAVMKRYPAVSRAQAEKIAFPANDPLTVPFRHRLRTPAAIRRILG